MTDQQINEPYPGVTDPAMIAKMDSCVQDVMGQGKDKSSAVAICKASVTEDKPIAEVVYYFDNGLLREAATKKEDGKDFPASDFAYVPDPEAPSTWKLRLTATPGGAPDTGIVGAAIAALGQGFRGQKVQIPAADLPAVKAKVRAAWSKANPDKQPQDMPPAIKEAEVSEAATYKNKIRAAMAAIEAVLEDRDIPEALRNSIKGVRETFKTKAWADLAGETTGTRQAEDAPQASSNISEHFAESYSGAVLMEAVTSLDPARAPLTVPVRLIRPGWGNLKDRHYYTPEVIKAAEGLFNGKKMYTTDHNPNEKNVMTEASVIDKILRYDEDGSPIAQVTVLNPDFAEMVRTRKAAGKLDTLECSVLGSGTAKPFELDGIKGKLVESITDIESVDWVTRAGAGGQALNVAESEPSKPKPEGGNMPDSKPVEVVKPPETVTITPVIEAEKPAPAEPTRLSESQVTALLEAEKRLPVASRERLAKGQYETEAAVKSAITDKLAELADALGAGKPFGLGAAPEKPKKTYQEQLAEANAALDKVNEKFGMNLIGGKK